MTDLQRLLQEQKLRDLEIEAEDDDDDEEDEVMVDRQGAR